MEKALNILHDAAGAACVLAAGLLGFTVCVLPTLLGGVAGDVMALIMLAMGVLLCGCMLYDVIETRNYETAALLTCITLCGCTTPKTVLKNDATGQVAVCGGNTSSSIMAGAVGYYMQKSNDSDCIADYLEQGFKRVKADETVALKSSVAK